MTIPKLEAGPSNNYQCEIRESVNGMVASGIDLVEPPEGFNTPSELSNIKISKHGNNYSCNIKPADLMDDTQFTQTVYVIKGGTGSNSGNNWANAMPTVRAAILRVATDNTPTKILVSSGVFVSGEGVNGFDNETTLAVAVSLQAVNGRVTFIAGRALTWTVNGTHNNVYQATRSHARNVIHKDILDVNGLPYQNKQVATLQACADEGGTWFTDNVTVYVNHINGAVVTDFNTSALIRDSMTNIITNHDFYISGFDMFGGRYNGLGLLGNGDPLYVVSDCRAAFAAGGNTPSPDYVDGFEIKGGKFTAIFDSVNGYNSKDGINFSNNGSSISKGLIVNCTGFDNGRYSATSTSCNGSTSHAGSIVVEVGNKWFGSFGTNCGYVQAGTQGWLVGVSAGKSDGDFQHGGGVSWGAFGAWQGAAELWLDHCTDVGSSIGLYAQGGGKINFRNHNGTGTHVGNVVAY